MWLGLQFPELGLEVFTAQPLAEAPPTVLLEEQRVVALNTAGGFAGIALGSTLATARSICADVGYFHRDGHRELEQLRFLAQAMYRFSSMVSIESPDGLLLEVGGSLKLFEDLAVVAEEAVRVCRSLGHEARHAFAGTPAASILLARSGARDLACVPLLQTNLLPARVEQLANMGIHHLGQ